MEHDPKTLLAEEFVRLKLTHAEDRPTDPEVVFAAITQQIRAQKQPNKHNYIGRQSFVRQYRAMFASLTVVAVLAVSLMWLRLSKTTQLPARHTYATTVGQRSTLTLIDGTRVTLAPNTTLTTYTNDGDAGRIVQLTGEAFFEVIPQHHAPFIVQTGNVRTHVLGTSFNVRHYASDTAVRVAVKSGKVMVQSERLNRQSVTLVAGQGGDVTDSTATIIPGLFVPQYTEWTSGRLVFDGAPVSEILHTLEQWYGYHFRLADPAISSRHVTATLEYGTSSEALTTLKLLLNVTLTVNGDIVTLHPKTSRQNTPSMQRNNTLDLFSPSLGVGR